MLDSGNCLEDSISAITRAASPSILDKAFSTTGGRTVVAVTVTLIAEIAVKDALTARNVENVDAPTFSYRETLQVKLRNVMVFLIIRHCFARLKSHQ